VGINVWVFPGYQRDEENDHDDDSNPEEPSVFEDREPSVFPGRMAGGTAYFTRGDREQPLRLAAAPPVTAAPQLKQLTPPVKKGGPYRARPDDEVDNAVAEFFCKNPQIFRKNSSLTRVSPGKYLVNGRQVTVTMHRRNGQSLLLVKDGPLTQPLAEYLENKEDDTAQYSGSVFQSKTAIHSIPQESRMTFQDSGEEYSRVQAMKVAKEQALAREKAAAMISKCQSPAKDTKTNYDLSPAKPGHLVPDMTSFMSTSSTRMGSTPPQSLHSASTAMPSLHSSSTASQHRAYGVISPTAPWNNSVRTA
jgi:hypothetical protein